MSDNEDKKEGGCCKGFNDEACPCLDQETGERSCGGADKDSEKPNTGCENCGCNTPKAP